MPDDRSLVALLLTSHLVRAPVPPLRASEFWSLLSRFEELESLVSLTPDAIETKLATSSEEASRIHELVRGAASFAFELENLQRRGIRVLGALEDEYPARLREALGSAAPPVLYVAGPVALLTAPCIGIVGSRDADPAAAAVAADVAALLAGRGITVCSGAAPGIGRIAIDAALDASGTAIGVLADSLERRLRDPATRRALLAERLCLFTPYKPSTGFTVANAMARNKLVYALAERTFVVQAALETGGTWTGASEWLGRDPSGVAVWTGPGSGPGNEALVTAGARRIERVEELLGGGGDGGTTEPGEPEQLGFRV